MSRKSPKAKTMLQQRLDSAVQVSLVRSRLDEDVLLDDGNVDQNIIEGLSMMCRRMKQGKIFTY